jgi:aminopeptidase YwaD
MMYQKGKTTLFLGILFITLILTTNSVNSEFLIKLHTNDKLNNKMEEIQLIDIISETLISINQTQLHTYIKKIQSFGPHPTGSNEIKKLKNYLHDELASFSLNVTSQTWENEEYTGENIIATLPGSLSKHNQVIICAHYDSIEISPGADDDGSGIAAVLTIASILSKYSFNNSILFILFSGEEQGCLGSNAYVEQALKNNVNIISVLALDKIGYAKTSEDSSIIRHHANPASSWMIDLSENISKKFNKLINLSIQRMPYDASSDHRAFNEYDIAGSNLVEHALNPFYHTSEDTIDKMNIMYLQKVTRLSTAIIMTIADGFSKISNEDINITILGKQNNPYNARLSIVIKNEKYPKETVSLSISIEMNHLFRNIPVNIQKEYYSIPCVWHFNKKINNSWVFHLGPQTYTKGFFTIKVSVHGLYKDFPVSKTLIKYGFIYPAYNLILFPI